MSNLILVRARSNSPAEILWLHFAIYFCAALPSIVLGQDLDNSVWLPKTLAEPYAEALSTASQYILTRAGCDRLLEAKLSENSANDNPKFILTCADERNTTANFVYWQSDIDSGFAADNYPEKTQDKAAAETLTEYEAQLKLQSDNRDLIASCKSHLQDLLGDREVVMRDSDIELSQRGDQPVTVSLSYQVGAGAYAPKFSAICRRDSFNVLNLRVFPTG
jgi:hypothetical protein